MTVERYAFHDCEATTAAGVPLRIPAGVHHVERRSLVFRVRLGGRELDLTLAEWERLLDAGCVGPVVAAADPPGTGETMLGETREVAKADWNVYARALVGLWRPRQLRCSSGPATWR